MIPTAKQAYARTWELSADYSRCGVLALQSGAQAVYRDMKPRQRGRAAQAARVRALGARLKALETDEQ